MKPAPGPARELDSCDDELTGENAAETDLLMAEDCEARRRLPQTGFCNLNHK